MIPKIHCPRSTISNFLAISLFLNLVSVSEKHLSMKIHVKDPPQGPRMKTVCQFSA